MSLRARLTLIYGGLLAVVLIGLGFGAQYFMAGRVADQTRSSLDSAAQYVNNNYRTTIGLNNAALPKLPQQKPLSGLYLEIIYPPNVIGDRSPSLYPDKIPINKKALTGAFLHRHSSYHLERLGNQVLEVYYSPMLVYFTLHHSNQASAVLLVAKSESDTTKTLDLLNAELFGGEAVLLVVFLVITWLVAGSALRPIKGMTARAASIAETRDFSGRVPVDTRAAELQKLALTFNHMLASLEEAYANQRRFLADASHELRTPLTVIQGNLQYLEQAHGAPEEERQEALRAASQEADRMGTLVGDLLSLSRADAGYRLEPEPIELDRVVVDAYRRIKSRDRARYGRDSGAQLRLGRLDEVVVQGDYERLLQLVLILLDNGVKYTPSDGHVTIELSLVSPEGAKICVADTGVGIRPRDRERIFERFYRSESARRMGEGSGLGLPIAQWIAGIHGGRIEFENVPEGGTRFLVFLPAVTAGRSPTPISEVEQDVTPAGSGVGATVSE